MKNEPVKMGRGETLFGLIYIVAQIFFLPVILMQGNALLPNPFNDAQLNFISFALNFICITVAFRRYLIHSLRTVFANISKCLQISGLGFALYWGCSILVNILILSIDPDFSNVNDDTISIMTGDNYMLMSVGTVILVPVVEETLYRGVVFGGLFRKSKVLAYMISILVFSAIHVVGYIGLFPPVRLILCFLQYLPAAFFLGWAYEKSGTIWSPILIHTTVNLIGMLAMK